MAVSRRYLPSLAWLTAFEAVARHGSVTQAALELDLTQGAVSRQIQKLEDQLGGTLFVREKKRLYLSAAGQSYAEDIRAAIHQISNASIKFRSNPDGGTLELAILPAFGTHWLAPKLPEFLGANAGITLNLSTRMAPFDFAQDRFHAAIHFGQNDWPGARGLYLMDEEMIPVVSPELMAASKLTSVEDVARLPLLHLQTRSRAWAKWFAHHGITTPAKDGMVFDQFAPMTQAAILGMGAALLPRYLAERDIGMGRLVQIAGAEATSVGAYYLVWPKSHDDYPPLTALRKWLASHMDKSS